MASAASAASAAGGTTTTVPEREFAGLDYANEKADEYRAALDTGANINSRECTNSSPVDFLYLSTIRGGRKTKQMSASGLMNAGGCGCGLVGGARRRSRSSRGSLSSRRIRGGYEEDGVGDSGNSGNSDAIEYANKYNDQYCIYENELFCFNAHPFLEHYSDIKITQEMLLNTLHKAQQKAFQEIEENEMIAASSSI